MTPAPTHGSGDDTLVALPALPLSSGVVLPGVVVTLGLDTPDARAALAAARAGDGRVLLVPRNEGRYAKVATVAKLESAGNLPDGTPLAIFRGLHRAVLGAATVPQDREGLWLQAEPIEDPTLPSEGAQELVAQLRPILEQVAAARGSRRLPNILRTVHAPGALADAVTSWSEPDAEHALEVLEAVDVEDRLRLVLEWARTTLAEHELSDRIRQDVVDGMERNQREFLLRQQLEAVRKELKAIGADAGDGDGGDDYRAKLADAVAGGRLPAAVQSAIEREVDRLERTSGQSPEQSWIRTWLDRIFELPWGTRTDDQLDVTHAREVLDADHTALEDVKDRIVEHLAVRKLRHDRGLDDPDRADGEGDGPAGRRGGSGAILLLVGPPGVGKTSLGESVARAMGRTFTRVALGGVRDEAEVRGHRRTYVGAQPGRIARALAEAGSMNPVLLLDEVDKLGGDWRGDPSSALLEVLDPAQNHTFRDHYLEVELDLSDVLFIATANVVEQIPGPLLDRMELVPLDGYTEDEKVVIARAHLFDRQRRRNGLAEGEVVVTDDALRTIVTDRTREAGVRTLERELGRLLRKVATKVASDPTAAPVTVDADDVRGYLGRPRFTAEAAERTAVPGVATGLAVTGAGGDVLFIEATASDGEPGLTLTGQLGDVMKESVQIALSYVRSHAAELGIEPAALERRFHVHVPAGAVPKDGPSAGVTMTTALVSLLTGRTVKPTVGMTGEVTLQGRVLPIGGVKQKVLAAHRAGLTEVVLPARNGGDLEDVPERVREVMTFHLAAEIGQVLEAALEPAVAGEAIAA